MMLSFKDLASPTWKVIHKHHTENIIQRGGQTGVERQASKQASRVIDTDKTEKTTQTLQDT